MPTNKSQAIPRSYRLDAVEEVLGLDRASLSRSGLLAEIRHYGYGLYDADEVEAWAYRLLRRRAFIELGALHRTAPLLEAPESDEFDFTHDCGQSAFFKPPVGDEEIEGWIEFLAREREDWPAWCVTCGRL